jgi:ribonuclease HI
MRGLTPVTTIYTDGACSGNPGPGGWAWAIPGGAWAAGHDPATTNQRMELQAALAALQAVSGPVEIVSDSTYVVHCFRDHWYEGWKKRGWKNSQRQPVANRDLWEPLVDEVLARGDVSFRWVKGHSGDPQNDLVDGLAVRAAQTQESASGTEPPDVSALSPDDVGRPARATAPGDRAPGPHRTNQQYRPDAHAVVVVGHQPPELGGYDENEVGARVRRKLLEILDAKRQQFGEIVVLSGLRLGAETLGAEAARLAKIPYVAVLPFPDPDARWPDAARRRYRELLGDAAHVVTLERKVPATVGDVAGALRRRDAWLARTAQEAVLVWDREDRRIAALHDLLVQQLGDDVWVIEPPRLPGRS